MHQRSSKSIGRLAGALAKAQAELTNPKKSLTATIYPDGIDRPGRTFNYASLADGLEIVRKTLSQHSIAVVQTTAIEEAAQIVKLTTVLAHSSGEWMASDWPVCDVKETAKPHRMGAALTYARRHALFALAGIAGEDDLDAPDLQMPTAHMPSLSSPSGSTNGSRMANGNGTSRGPFFPQSTVRRGEWLDSKRRLATAKTLLAPTESATLRDRLVGEIANIGSADDAALWAYCNMRAKNRLIPVDAQRVEEAFQAIVASSTAPVGTRVPGPSKHIKPRVRQSASSDNAPPPRRQTRGRKQPPQGIDKAVLAFPEPRRIRDREHVRFVAKQPCLVCARVPCDPHHLRFTQQRALGRKVSDEFTVPLCRGHHRELHRCGDEARWWQRLGIDPEATARELWLQTHPLPDTPVDRLLEPRQCLLPLDEADKSACAPKSRSIKRIRQSKTSVKRSKSRTT